MKKLLTTAGLLVFLTINSLSNCNALEFSGNTELSNFKTQEEISISGNADLKNIEARSLEVSGVVEFDSIKITSNQDSDYVSITGPIQGKHLECKCNIKVTGPVSLSDVKARKMNITGPAELKKMRVDEIKITGPLDMSKSDIVDLNITGPLHINESTVSKITVQAEEITIDDALTGDIIVLPNNPNKENKKQKVILKNAVSIKGDITFIGKNGEVQMDEKAMITGKIIGGKVIKKGKNVKNSN